MHQKRLPMPEPMDSAIDLYWIPLGAGGHFVHFNGTVFEAITAFAQRRERAELYHAALVVTTADSRFVIEMTPIPDARGADRGGVLEGRWARGGRRACGSSATRSDAGRTGSSRTSGSQSQALFGSATMRAALGGCSTSCPRSLLLCGVATRCTLTTCGTRTPWCPGCSRVPVLTWLTSNPRRAGEQQGGNRALQRRAGRA